MTDAQFGILVTVIGSGCAAIAAAIRFSVSRVVSALEKNTTAMLENTKSNAVLATKIDNIADYVQRGSTPLPRAPSQPALEGGKVG